MSQILPESVVWYRYVDDIFCLWPKNEHVSYFLTRLNNLVPSINFTIGKANEKQCLPFFDVLVHQEGKEFSFSIYREPTNILSYIHYYSEHPENVKVSVFSSMFLRAF